MREIQKLLDAAEMVSYAGHGFNWHLRALCDALQLLSGFNKYAEYGRDRTCLDPDACRQCGATGGALRTLLIDLGQHERETWDGKRWVRGV
jgi:hypothetical protein